MANAQKQVVVVEMPKFGGLVLNAQPSDLAEGKGYTVPFGKAMKAAKATGIDNYVVRLENGKRIGLKPNNKVLAPSIRKAYKPMEQPKAAKPGTEVNKPKAAKNPKGSRKARKAAKQQAAPSEQVALVIEDSPKVNGSPVRGVESLDKHEARLFNNLIYMGELAEARKMLGL